MMPGESGFETCAQLKSDPLTANIPIIFLSSLDDVKSKVAGLKIGGVDYIAKPVHGEEVLARVRVHLRIRENNRAQVAGSIGPGSSSCATPNRPSWCVRRIARRRTSRCITAA
jgi:DNA-binding response OmpR family regulator